MTRSGRRDLIVSRLLLALAGLGIVVGVAVGELAVVAFCGAAAVIIKFVFWQRHLRSK